MPTKSFPRDPANPPEAASAAGASGDSAESGERADHHVTTFTHDGRFWDVLLHFVADPLDPHAARARFRFVPADMGEGEVAVETAVIIIESSRGEAVRAAQAYDRHHLAAMLRSAS